MKKLNYLIVILLFFAFINTNAQEKRKFKVHTVAFYNVENLFDTINNPNKFDEASPMMELNFNRGDVYKKKVRNMARVISEIGADVSKNTPVIIGLSEVENRQVIEDLANEVVFLLEGVVYFKGTPYELSVKTQTENLEEAIAQLFLKEGINE